MSQTCENMPTVPTLPTLPTEVKDTLVYDNPFSSLFVPVYSSVVNGPIPTEMRTPAIPYNYMPRPPFTTTSPGELPAYIGKSEWTEYKDASYQQKVNDPIMERRTLDFSNPTTAANFTPSVSKSSLF
jgi:hypothetical protein